VDDRALRLRKTAQLEGTIESMRREQHEKQRGMSMRTIWHCADDGSLPIGEWVYVESGPHFHDIGILREIYTDEIGCSIAILDHSARKQNETNNDGPTYLINTNNGLHISRASVHQVQLAKNRYGANWKEPN